VPRRPGGGTYGGRAGVAGLIAVVLAAGCSLRPIDLKDERPLALRSTITASDGTILARLYRQNRALASLEDVPQSVVDAVIAAEDQRFFEHPGYDGRAIVRAALRNLEEGKVVEGGSTITQQYVKNVYFRNPRQTIERKARELRLAIEIERRYSKQEILERYLNTVYFGEGAYGINAAAEVYFDRSFRSLLPHEAALLAALIKAPALYDPRDHPHRALARRNYVLERMLEFGMLDEPTARDAQRASLGMTQDVPQIATRQPYFVEAVKREVVQNRRLGPTGVDRARALWRGGLNIETTLDRDLQRAAESAVEATLNRPGDPAAALVAIRPQSGRIVAMVGGRDWSTSQVNLALGKAGGGSGRQSGSAFKPIVAATALEAGIGLETRYESGPLSVTFANGEPWVVGNSTEGGGSGFMTIEDALVNSVNGVFARLALELGTDRIITQARLMGVRSELPNGPSIALGSGDVSVLDMAAAYATIANHGTAIEPTTIHRITTATGDVVTPVQKRIEEAISPGNAYLLTKAMEGVIESGTGTVANIGRPAAGKTGTTNDYADAWFVGFTPQLVAAVWVGHPEGRVPMTSVHGIRVMGGTFPALIWKRFMLAAHRGVPVRQFLPPKSDMVTIEIDPETGLLATSWCPGEVVTMLRQLAPTEYCPPPPPPPTPTPTVVPSPIPSSSDSDEDDGGKDDGDKPKEEPSPKPTPTPSQDGDGPGGKDAGGKSKKD
jgi:penicillin-binding protein 1A